MSKGIQKNIREEEFYQTFIDECKSIIGEAKFKSTIELIKGKWELGKRISEEELNFEKAKYGERIIETIAEDIGWSNSHVWKCIQFYLKFQLPDFEEVIPLIKTNTKEPTWYQITQNILPKPKEEEEKEKNLKEKQGNCPHARLKCSECGKIFTLEELLKIVRG